MCLGSMINAGDNAMVSPVVRSSTSVATDASYVEIAGDPAPCRLSVEPFYDPRGERLRS